ncbi:MAG: RecX family transcriptional regulator [Bacteroidales bacterium]|nr:RecX family transcriptional regulator [Bacteroidales bacterium]
MASNSVLSRAQKYCDYQDRYQQEVRDKLYAWGAKSNDVEQILCQLVETDYINEERYARAFARGKFRIKHWGKTKIRHELKQRRISDYCIKQGLLEIADEDYLETLKQVIDKKYRETAVGTKNLSPIQQRKIATYAISRGFEPDLVWEVIKNR